MVQRSRFHRSKKNRKNQYRCTYPTNLSQTKFYLPNPHVYKQISLPRPYHHTGAGKYLVGQRFIARMDKDRFNVLCTHQTQAANVAELRGRPTSKVVKFQHSIKKGHNEKSQLDGIKLTLNWFSVLPLEGCNGSIVPTLFWQNLLASLRPSWRKI